MHPLLDEGFLILSFASTLALFSLSLHVHRALAPAATRCYAVKRADRQ